MTKGCRNETYDEKTKKYICKRSNALCISREKGLMCSLFEPECAKSKEGRLKELRLLKKEKLKRDSEKP